MTSHSSSVHLNSSTLPHNIGVSLPSLLRSREVLGPKYSQATLKQRNNSSSDKETLSQYSYDPGNFRSSVASSITWINKLHLKKRLQQHKGCVNTIQWNKEGNLLVTGSDDRYLNIWSGEDYHLIQSLSTGHTRNIFCAHFVPGDNTKIVSCAMDSEVRLSYAREGVGTKVGSDGKMRNSISGLEDVRGLVSTGSVTPTDLLYSGYHMSFKLAFLPFSPSVFLSTHQDGSVRLFDLRCKQRADGRGGTVIVDLESTSTQYTTRNSSGLNPNALAMDPRTGNKFILGCSDPVLRLYDIRFSSKKGGSADEFKLDKAKKSKILQSFAPREDTKSLRSCYVTGVDYNEAGEIVATYSRENVYLFEENAPFSYSQSQSDDHLSSTPSEKEQQKGKPNIALRQFQGHRNTQTFLKEVRFMGNNNFIATGSDCGHMYIWEKKSGELVQVLKADENVVNGIAPHPFLPYVAACGIDWDGKIFEVGEKQNVNKELMTSLKKRHQPRTPQTLNDDDDDDDEEDEISNFLHQWSFPFRISPQEEGTTEGEQERREREILNSRALILRIILGTAQAHRQTNDNSSNDNEHSNSGS
eukprot:TRINITY_DN4769_c0_g1_i1.p1 TRINITY_DN4769_c0_g1~~TRINITY_DN4769_c0_g1_i1.p1  ORF type:complete len:584 (-),score=97.08 TRINITY_DN4769_c0_g1_i1:137-1888(-)